MKRIQSTYHNLNVIKTADPKLRKAIITNCNQETLKSICECALNLLDCNVPISACNKRKFRTYKYSVRKVAGKIIPSQTSEMSYVLLTVLSALLQTLAGLLFRSRKLCYKSSIWSRPKSCGDTSTLEAKWSHQKGNV